MHWLTHSVSYSTTYLYSHPHPISSISPNIPRISHYISCHIPYRAFSHPSTPTPSRSFCAIHRKRIDVGISRKTNTILQSTTTTTTTTYSGRQSSSQYCVVSISTYRSTDKVCTYRHIASGNGGIARFSPCIHHRKCWWRKYEPEGDYLYNQRRHVEGNDGSCKSLEWMWLWVHDIKWWCYYLFLFTTNIWRKRCDTKYVYDVSHKGFIKLRALHWCAYESNNERRPPISSQNDIWYLPSLHGIRLVHLHPL